MIKLILLLIMLRRGRLWLQSIKVWCSYLLSGFGVGSVILKTNDDMVGLDGGGSRELLDIRLDNKNHQLSARFKNIQFIKEYVFVFII